MKEYLLCRPEHARKTRFIPAHLIYKINDGHLFREQIPISLNGGVMVIGKVQGIPSLQLTKRILTECLRFNFTGVLIQLPPIPDENSLAFAKELSSVLKSKNIKLFLPMTYSETDATLLIPAINTNTSFIAYLKEIRQKFKNKCLALQLSNQPIKFKIPQKEPNYGIPISFDELKDALKASSAMTFYSPDLCTNYFTHSDSFIVFDTPQTFAVKRKIAADMGFDSCFYIISPKTTSILEKLEESR